MSEKIYWKIEKKSRVSKEVEEVKENEEDQENGADKKEETNAGNTLQAWWKGLDNDRASRAMLRRCATLDEVSLCPAYQRFFRYLLSRNVIKEDVSGWQRDRLAMIAGLLAHVKNEDNQRFPLHASGEVGNKTPLVSELRFRNLLKIDDIAELFVNLRRTLPLVGHQLDILQLATDVDNWGDHIKKQWAYKYHWPPKQVA